MSDIQSRLFNGGLAWTNNHLDIQPEIARPSSLEAHEVDVNIETIEHIGQLALWEPGEDY